MSPDKRQHRGPHAEDRRLFDAEQIPRLRLATDELSWLLTRGYTMKSSLKIVGDRHGLAERQRLAVSRAACADHSASRRSELCVPFRSLRRERLIVDGFNILITIEAALSGGALLLCRDGCIRDLSSVHGSYRSVSETERAILLIGEELDRAAPQTVRWLLDKPISNSGRLAERIRRLCAEKGWDWSVEVVFNPDAEIKATDEIAVTSDSTVLDQVRRWTNLNAHIISERLTNSWIVDLRV